MTGRILFPAMISLVLMGARYRTAFDLYKSWISDGLPDYVSAVYEDDEERLHVLLTEDGADNGKELADSVSDQSTIVIEYGGQYSENELQAVSDEICDSFQKEDQDIRECYVGYGPEGGFGQSGQEPRVVILVSEGKLENYRHTFEARYGDRVVVGPYTGDPEGAPEGNENGARIVIGVMVLLLTAIEIIINHRSFHKELDKDAHREMAKKRYFEHHGQDPEY